MQTTTIPAITDTRRTTWPAYSYEAILAAATKVNWRVDDLIGGDKTLDFTRPFLPESLARVAPLSFLNDREKMVLNQIRGHDYLYTFGLVEEFIVPFILDHVRPCLEAEDARVQALLNFAAEEAKHIELFKRFRKDFLDSFRTPCEVIGPPQAIAQAILAKHPLGVALTILHIEWMTQRHYLESVKDDGDLDSQFKSLLKHHWMEEAQHAKLDTLMVQAMSQSLSPEEIEAGIQAYVEIGGMLDEGLMQQVVMDLESLERALDRRFTAEEREEFLAVQRQAVRWTYLGSGMTHRNFLETMELLKPGMREAVLQIAPTFC